MMTRISFLSTGRRRTMSLRGLFVSLVLSANVAAAGAPATPALATTKAEVRAVSLSWPAEALVEAVHQATLAAQVPGRVVDVRVDAGDKVKQGQLLMRIDEREATQAAAGATAQAAAAEADRVNAQAAFERTKNLFAQKFVSQAALDQAEATWKGARGRAEAAKAGSGQAATAKSFTSVTAPFSGIVAQRLTELGEMAAPGKPLLTLFEPGGLRVVANIPQYRVAEVRKNLKARIEFPDSGRWVDGAKVEVLPTADNQTHVVRVRVTLPADAAGVMPGMFARAHFVIGTANKLVVSQKSILRRGEMSAVYVVDAQGGIALRQVRLGENLAGDLVEVLAGVAAGENVALDPIQAGIRLKSEGARG